MSHVLNQGPDLFLNMPATPIPQTTFALGRLEKN